MKIKALRTIIGKYGKLIEGQEANISDSVATELIAAGLVEQVGDSDGENVDEAIEKANEAKAKEAGSSVTIMQDAEPTAEKPMEVKAPKVKKK